MGRTSKALLAALALAAVTAGAAAHAGELRGRVGNVDRQSNTLTIGGQTIHVGNYPLAGIVEGSRYTVRFHERDGRNTLISITQEDG